MNLDKIKTDITWNDAAGSINSNFAKLVQALATLGGGSPDEEKVVIFDATCSADPWSLNELQTPTTVAEIKAAIEGNKPIYAKFANGFTPVGYAGIVAQKYVSMDIYLMDVEGGYIRTVNIYSGEGDQWSWDGFSHDLNGGGGGGSGENPSGDYFTKQETLQAIEDYHVILTQAEYDAIKVKEDKLYFIYED